MNIFGKINAGDYREEHITISKVYNCNNHYIYKLPGDPKYITTKFCPECGKKIVDEITEQIKQYQEVRIQCRKSNEIKFNQFKADALAHVNLTKHPNANKIFDYAWDRGHSNGYSEVVCFLEELAALIII